MSVATQRRGDRTCKPGCDCDGQKRNRDGGFDVLPSILPRQMSFARESTTIKHACLVAVHKSDVN